MFQSIISGFLFLCISIFVGPALLIAGFQIMQGQKVRLPSMAKPLAKTLFALAEMVVETSGVVANMVAERLPPRYAYLLPAARLLVKLAIVAILLCMVVSVLLSFARR